MDEVLKKTIIAKSGLGGDPKDKGVSIWHGENENDLLAQASRNLNRNIAINTLDKIIENKIEGLSFEKSEDNIDAVLEQIALKRQAEKEAYLEKSNNSRRGKSIRKSKSLKIKQEEKAKDADSRLDILIDKGVSRLTRKPAKTLNSFANSIKKKELALSIKMASYVDIADDFVDRAFVRVYRTKKTIRTYIRNKKAAIKLAIYRRRRPILAGLAGLVVMIASFSMALENVMAYEYMYNGKVLGLVADKDHVYDAIDVIGDKLALTYGAEINVSKDKDISFRKVAKMDKEIDSIDDVLDRFTYMKDMTATAYALMVNGQQKALLNNKEEAEDILKTIKATFSKEKAGVKYESIGFAENVTIKEYDTKLGHIQNKSDVLDYMLTGAVEIKTYTIKSGDTFGQIAKNLGMTQAELVATNPDVNPAKLRVGQELVLNRVRPVLTVQTTEIQEYMAPIDFDITYEESSSIFKGETAVKKAGVKGQKQVVARVVKNNGEEVNRVELQAEVISLPSNQIVVKGTKPLPPLIGTGVIQYPVRGRLSSGFGMRWGRMHNGIDLANPYGTTIRAADGGVVTSAGWEGALGYCVRIDHGQNITTVYGHCSKMLVKKGDKVYQGQHIANVGSTGRSTGPHLHFEVHVNGVPKNPLNYLK